MKRGTVESLWVSSVLVLLGVGLRLYFQEIPNFAPVAAVALFAGYYLSSRKWALAVPVATMLISDRLIGGYQPALMLANYALLSLPALCGGPLRKHFDITSANGRRSALSLVGLLGCSLGASIIFFVGSNLVTWAVTPWYTRDISGLVNCYVNAIPFFRYTLLGDLSFAACLFGGYATVKSLHQIAQPVPARETVRR